MKIISFIFFALNAFCYVNAAIINKKVQRVVDASSSIVKVSLDITAEGVEDSYQILFPTAQAEHLAILTVSLKDSEDDLLTVQPPVVM